MTKLQRAKRTHAKITRQARALAFQLQYTTGTEAMHERLQQLVDRASTVYEYARCIMADKAVAEFNEEAREKAGAGKPTIEIIERSRIELLH
jgi:acetyl-CoA carboxylase carboxyltransferase component